MIIPSQNTQVSPYRDLFKGCNKALGSLAKGFRAHSTPGFNNAAAHIPLVRDQTGPRRTDTASKPNPALKQKHLSNFYVSECLYVRGNNDISLHRNDEPFLLRTCVCAFFSKS